MKISGAGARGSSGTSVGVHAPVASELASRAVQLGHARRQWLAVARQFLFPRELGDPFLDGA